jgi:hypothetical protein
MGKLEKLLTERELITIAENTAQWYMKTKKDTWESYEFWLMWFYNQKLEDKLFQKGGVLS